jgi:hypothetical protein
VNPVKFHDNKTLKMLVMLLWVIHTGQAWKIYLSTVGIEPTVERHIFFQACTVWIYTQSNITSIIFTWVHYTNTEKIKTLKSTQNARYMYALRTYFFQVSIHMRNGITKLLFINQSIKPCFHLVVTRINRGRECWWDSVVTRSYHACIP